MFDTRELGRRPGALRRVSRTVPAPADLGNEVIGVRPGEDLDVALRMESVMEGVLVTGTVRGSLAGECVRCLEPLTDEVEADFQEMFSYPDAESYAASAADDEAAEDDDERLLLQGDLFDLEPVLRDAVVLSLPLRPVCREDCPGLCPECGARLAGDPDHHHDEAVDVRWAALGELAEALRPGRDSTSQEKAPRPGGDDPQER